MAVAVRDREDAIADEQAEHITRALAARERDLVSNKHPGKKRRAKVSRPDEEEAWIAQLEEQQAAWFRTRGVMLQARNYLTSVDDNLLVLSDATRGDLEGGSGQELGTPERPGKILAPWSSTALAINVFETWRDRDTSPILRALGVSGSFPRVRFEAKFSTGLRGGSANLDVVLEDGVLGRIAIESKLLEPYRDEKGGKDAFSPAYFAKPHTWEGLPVLREFAWAISEGRVQFTRLDATQLIKHIVALRHDGQPFELIHLWYRPEGLPGTNILEQEIEAFCAITARDGVHFRSFTYQELFARLRSEAPLERDYLAYLGDRYFSDSIKPAPAVTAK